MRLRETRWQFRTQHARQTWPATRWYRCSDNPVQGSAAGSGSAPAHGCVAQQAAPGKMWHKCRRSTRVDQHPCEKRSPAACAAGAVSTRPAETTCTLAGPVPASRASLHLALVAFKPRLSDRRIAASTPPVQCKHTDFWRGILASALSLRSPQFNVTHVSRFSARMGSPLISRRFLPRHINVRNTQGGWRLCRPPTTLSSTNAYLFSSVSTFSGVISFTGT